MVKDRLLKKVLLALKKQPGQQLDYSLFPKSTEEEVDDAIRRLDQLEYIAGVFYADDRPYETSGVYLTAEGEAYLKESRCWAKILKIIKLFGSIIGITKRVI